MIIGGAAAFAFAVAPEAAHAAGGAQVVDDAFPETPALCHVENWLAQPTSGGGTLIHIGLGCTPKKNHLLELDAAWEHTTGPGPSSDTFFPGFKYLLFTLPGDKAIALSGSVGIDRRTGRLSSVALVLPMSATLGKYTQLNLNIGWQLLRAPGTADEHQVTWGAQIYQAVAPHFWAVGEVFGANGQRPGAQGGVRFSPGPEKVDIDLLAAKGAGHNPATLTVGVTVRL
jgi:hypothetical protein